MIMKILKKEWFIWKFWKKGGSREKGGGGNEIHAPCACGFNTSTIQSIHTHTLMLENSVVSTLNLPGYSKLVSSVFEPVTTNDTDLIKIRHRFVLCGC